MDLQVRISPKIAENRLKIELDVRKEKMDENLVKRKMFGWVCEEWERETESLIYWEVRGFFFLLIYLHHIQICGPQFFSNCFFLSFLFIFRQTSLPITIPPFSLFKRFPRIQIKYPCSILNYRTFIIKFLGCYNL